MIIYITSEREFYGYKEKMKINKSLIVAMCFMAMSSAAFAADEWKGAYAGLQTGYAYTSTEFGDLDDRWDNQEMNGITDRGGIGGAYAGYTRQNGTLVYGVEAAWSKMNNKDRSEVGNYNSTYGAGANLYTKFSSLSTVKARIGIAAENSQFYMAAGPAWAKTKFHNDITSSSGQVFEKSATVGGMALAGGIESKFWKGLIGRFQAEYVLLDSKTFYDTKNLSSGNPSRFRDDSSMLNLTFGVAYKFY